MWEVTRFPIFGKWRGLRQINATGKFEKREVGRKSAERHAKSGQRQRPHCWPDVGSGLWEEADINQQTISDQFVENDPKRSSNLTANLLHANRLTVGDRLAIPIRTEASCLIDGRMSNKNDNTDAY
jgi:hypothetical protein